MLQEGGSIGSTLCTLTILCTLTSLLTSPSPQVVSRPSYSLPEGLSLYSTSHPQSRQTLGVAREDTLDKGGAKPNER